MCRAIPTPRLYCPDKLFPSLAYTDARKDQVDISLLSEQHGAPGDDTGEGGVRARHAEECAKVFHANRCMGNVNREADEAHDEAS